MSRRLDIEKALVWAYRDELPKTPRPGGTIRALGLPAVWRRVDRFGELLELVDEDGLNQWGVIADPFAVAAPHVDAVALHNAVVDLAGLAPGLPEAWDPLEDLDLGDDRPAILGRARERLFALDRDGRGLVLRHSLPRLIQRCAILGAPDVALGEIPIRREVTGPTGRPQWFRRETVVVDGVPIEIEVDGYNGKAKRPHADAYRKFQWDPDPVEIAVDRGLFELWRQALDVLVEELAGRLDSIELVESRRSIRPWLAPDELPRVLYDLRPPKEIPRPARAKRGRKKSSNETGLCAAET
jgi:hypothetical protein